MEFKTKTLASVDAPQNADSVALLGDPCIHNATSERTQAAVIGTYTLQDSQNRKRKGSALLLHASSQRTSVGTTYKLETKSDTPLPAVLDVCADQSTVYAACAEDSVARLSSTAPYSAVSKEVIIQPDNSDLLTLSLDVTSGTETFVATSHSSGDVSLYSTTPSDTRLLERRKSHDLEAWTVCRHNNNIYSGGDDGTLIGWTPKCPNNLIRKSMAHGGVGVTSVAVEPGAEHQIWTGGYDDTLRVWDLRHMRQSLMEQPVGGGVWRIKFHPQGLVLIATMYDGFKVIRREEELLKVIGRYDEHKSIAYGAAWLPALDSDGAFVALTASFYDCAVRLWSLDTNEVAEG